MERSGYQHRSADNNAVATVHDTSSSMIMTISHDHSQGQHPVDEPTRRFKPILIQGKVQNSELSEVWRWREMSRLSEGRPRTILAEVQRSDFFDGHLDRNAGVGVRLSFLRAMAVVCLVVAQFMLNAGG